MLQLYILLAAIADPVRKLSSVFTRLQSGSAASDRIFTFVDRQPRVLPNSDGPRLARAAWLPPRQRARPARSQLLPVKPNYVEFRDVCFSYDKQQPLLSHINLTIRAGETVALVGPNGCGKTTLVGLLPRFYDPDHGSVFIDGLDLRSVHLRSLRQQIGMVTQDTFLFDDTIYNNIAYGTRGRRRRKSRTAARRAYAHDFILGQAGRYQFRVGEAGEQALRRTEAAPRPGPRHPPQPQHPHPRRVHQPGRQRQRGRDPPRPGGVQAGPDDLPDHAQAAHAGNRRSHHRAGSGPHRRHRRPQRTDRHLPGVSAPARSPGRSGCAAPET